MGNTDGLKKTLGFPPHVAGKEADIRDAIFEGASSSGTRDQLMPLWGLDPNNTLDKKTFNTKLKIVMNNLNIRVLEL